MTIHAQKARAAAGERVIFDTIDGPPAVNPKALPAPGQGAASQKRIINMSMDKQARLRKVGDELGDGP